MIVRNMLIPVDNESVKCTDNDLRILWCVLRKRSLLWLFMTIERYAFVKGSC